jgi:hypothetical protein
MLVISGMALSLDITLIIESTFLKEDPYKSSDIISEFGIIDFKVVFSTIPASSSLFILTWTVPPDTKGFLGHFRVRLLGVLHEDFQNLQVDIVNFIIFSHIEILVLTLIQKYEIKLKNIQIFRCFVDATPVSSLLC